MNRLVQYHRLIWVTLMVMMSTALWVMPAMADDFYTAPSPLPGAPHGTLIKSRVATADIDGDQATVNHGVPGYSAWNIMYHSTDALDQPNAVSGTVMVPTAPWSGTGSRPIIIYCVGTQGIAEQCAPSRQMEAGIFYENPNIIAALNAGYALVLSDYAGYTNGALPTYMIGTSEGQAALDAYKAALSIGAAGLSASAKVAIWGYSQGGQAAAWAGQLQPSYLPELNTKLIGVAAGGVPADLLATGRMVDGQTGSFFFLATIMGLYAQYPDEVPLYDLANAAGLAAIAKSQEICLFEGLLEFRDTSLSTFLKPAYQYQTTDQLYAQFPAVVARSTTQKLGTMRINVPVYLYHGTADEFIPLDDALDLRDDYCSRGVQTVFGVYPGEHLSAMMQAPPHVLSWFGDRLNGLPVTDACTHNPRPVANHNPLKGDYIVSLNEWPLAAEVHVQRLQEGDFIMPDDSTFTAETNMTGGRLDGEEGGSITGVTNIAKYDAGLKLIMGIPWTIGLAVVPDVEAAGIGDPWCMYGKVDLDADGWLHVHGHNYENLVMTGAKMTKMFGGMVSCSTSAPIDFPIDLDEQVGVLGTGMVFEGEATFPRIEGGMLCPTYSMFMTGPGQVFKYVVTPPEPYNW